MNAGAVFARAMHCRWCPATCDPEKLCPHGLAMFGRTLALVSHPEQPGLRVVAAWRLDEAELDS